MVSTYIQLTASPEGCSIFGLKIYFLFVVCCPHCYRVLLLSIVLFARTIGVTLETSLDIIKLVSKLPVTLVTTLVSLYIVKAYN